MEGKEQRPFPEGREWPLHATCVARKRGEEENKVKKRNQRRRSLVFHVAYNIKDLRQ